MSEIEDKIRWLQIDLAKEKDLTNEKSRRLSEQLGINEKTTEINQKLQAENERLRAALENNQQTQIDFEKEQLKTQIDLMQNEIDLYKLEYGEINNARF